jgi:alginate O-acetyltransferase complex protein AlgJ
VFKLSLKKISEWSVIVTFLLAISLPFALTLFVKSQNESQTENRRLDGFPVMQIDSIGDLRDFFKKYKGYFDDHFGFRETLVDIRSHIMALGFGISPLTKVIFGKNQWLFYDGGTKSNVINKYYLGVDPFTPEQLSQMAAKLTAYQQWLAQRHIRYYLVIPPDKETIYPEYLPGYLQHPLNESRLDQFIQYLRSHTSISVIDLRPTLLAHKKSGILYLKTDTHWNPVGAFYGYRKIMETIHQQFPQTPLLTFKDFTRGTEAFSGDLARMIDLPNIYQEHYPSLSLTHPCGRIIALPAYAKPDELPALKPFASVCNNPHLPKAVILRDSFTIAMIPELGEDFRRIVFNWSYKFPYQMIEKEHPDLVIQEILERQIHFALTKAA